MPALENMYLFSFIFPLHSCALDLGLLFHKLEVILLVKAPFEVAPLVNLGDEELALASACLDPGRVAKVSYSFGAFREEEKG